MNEANVLIFARSPVKLPWTRINAWFQDMLTYQIEPPCFTRLLAWLPLVRATGIIITWWFSPKWFLLFHSLRGRLSRNTVVRAMNERFQWEMPFFRVFQLRNPRTDFRKNFAQLITSETPPHMQIFGSVGPKGACLHMREVVIVWRLFFRFFSFMLIAPGPPVGPIIVVNGLNDAFWWHSHFLYGLV